ncbi:MAG TPA: sugar transferase, partial [Caulobacteraceae bacterium]|nr:sugar transferase [Caulobacteraceae bacterium]
MTLSAASARADAAEASLTSPEPSAQQAGDPASTDEMQHALSAMARRMRSRERRGPMRPGRLVSSRARLRGEALWRAYRIGDGAVVLALSWLCCDLANPAGVWRSPVGAAAPYFAGGLLLLAMLRALNGYRFGARESLVVHLGRIAGGFALAWLASAAAAVLGLYLPDQRAAIASCLAVTSAALVGLHLAWWATTRAMRRSGRLTPNIVVVGATPNAERLIDKAIESHEVAVLGIFDDRLDRAPREIHGVPVLGDTDALMSHRIMPYVDRVVITVNSTAKTRIQSLVEKLRVLPN